MRAKPHCFSEVSCCHFSTKDTITARPEATQMPKPTIQHPWTIVLPGSLPEKALRAHPASTAPAGVACKLMSTGSLCRESGQPFGFLHPTFLWQYPVA